MVWIKNVSHTFYISNKQKLISNNYFNNNIWVLLCYVPIWVDTITTIRISIRIDEIIKWINEYVHF